LNRAAADIKVVAGSGKIQMHGFAYRSAAITGLVFLAACGGGGGGNTMATSMPSAPTTPAPTPALTYHIGPPTSPRTGGITSPSFNFANNPPPVGTVFPLAGTVAQITPTDVTGVDGQGITATFRGITTTASASYAVFDLDIPSLSVHAANLQGDGTTVTLSNGSKISAGTAFLNYTLLGVWGYSPASGESYIGQFATGYLTPLAAVPASGTATYIGTGNSGGAVGVLYLSIGGNSIVAGTLSGDVNLTVDFAGNKVNGMLNNMQAKLSVNSSGTEVWPNVVLTGSLIRGASGTSLSGTTSTTGLPSAGGVSPFSSAATGNFAAGLYGPAAQEVGGAWTLYESNGGLGRAAVGTFAATKQ
jgi:hypothetical protein